MPIIYIAKRRYADPSRRPTGRKRVCGKRLFRTIKEEEVYLSEYESLQDAREQLGHFIDVVYCPLVVSSRFALGLPHPRPFPSKLGKGDSTM